MPYEHLRVVRDEPINRRKKNPFPGYPKPADSRQHAHGLQASLAAAVQTPEAPGFDERKLLRINVIEGFPPEALEAIPGLSVVSQEGRDVALLFSSEAALALVDQRLSMLVRDGKVTRGDLLLAIRGFDAWRPEDRMGAALTQLGLPDLRSAIVDIELWPLDSAREREAMLAAFELFLAQQHIPVLDRLNQPSLVICKARVSEMQLAAVLNYRDVRLVDLPARFGFGIDVFQVDANALPAVAPVALDAPGICVLDTGVAAGHPLLSPAVGDTANFVARGELAVDSDGHGTRVAGLALYGSMTERMRDGFQPGLRLFAGKVFTNDGEDQTRFVEKAVEEAVRYFREQYGCKVYCLAYGDSNKAYDGRHIRGLAYTLDRLSRELGVLFVVPTGNLLDAELPDNALEAYPAYLMQSAHRLLDPATAVNAITVGGLAEFELDHEAQRYPERLETSPLARRNQPSPFTRIGPSIAGAVKPEFVAYGGNMAHHHLRSRRTAQRLGVISTSNRFVDGRMFDDALGTSFAAPQVAHLAASILRYLPHASVNCIRAVLGVHARVPGESDILFANNEDAKLALCGYGRIDPRHLFESADGAVTLLGEDAIHVDHHHFYELPLPEDFWRGRKRIREVSVALAYCPEVKTTRLGYRAVRLSFNVVEAESLEQVTGWFNSNRIEAARKLQESTSFVNITATTRSKGTLQCATWTFKASKARRLFIVVTRKDEAWYIHGEGPESYALAVTFRDLENPEADLYMQVRQRVQQREQARVRARG